MRALIIPNRPPDSRAAIWSSLIQAELPELAAGALSAFRPYIEWIDASLVAGERFSPVLLRSLWSPAPSVRAGAVGCVRELVSKRMPALSKLSLIRRLQLVEVRSSPPAPPNRCAPLATSNRHPHIANAALISRLCTGAPRGPTAPASSHTPPCLTTQVCKRLASAGPPDGPASAESCDDAEAEEAPPEEALLVAVAHELLTAATHLEDAGRGGAAGGTAQSDAAERAAGHASAISDVEARLAPLLRAQATLQDVVVTTLGGHEDQRTHFAPSAASVLPSPPFRPSFPPSWIAPAAASVLSRRRHTTS